LSPNVGLYTHEWDDDTDKLISVRHGTAHRSLRTMLPYSCYECGTLELSGIAQFTGVKITSPNQSSPFVDTIIEFMVLILFKLYPVLY
jgi:hypothetical protein